jgi:hypothetical protein
MKMKELSREEQLDKLRRRYAHRKPEGKARLLDELCEQYGYHRKHAIRLLNAPAEPPCGKRWVEALPLWVPCSQKHSEPLSAHQH